MFCDCGGGSFNGSNCTDMNKYNPINEELSILDEKDRIKAKEYIIE